MLPNHGASSGQNKKATAGFSDRSFPRAERSWVENYLFFFLWRFLRRRFLRLCVAILWRFLLRPHGMDNPRLLYLNRNLFRIGVDKDTRTASRLQRNRLCTGFAGD
jgi:hypothetical protein